MNVTIDENLKGKELHDFLIKNKNILIAEKKYSIKRSDAFSFCNVTITDKGEIIKAPPIEEPQEDFINVSCVINTTKWLDSHRDVHIDGLWKKSLSENKGLYLLQEHEMTFKGIITDDIEAITKKIAWKTLGIDAAGYTEALVFNAKIYKARNPYMFEQYKRGYVKNHSVGMKYVQMEMAVNDEDYPEEFAVWNKYFDGIVNKQEAENVSYFFAVTEAKAIEGSAVPIGSNRVTPTLSVKADTEGEPLQSTPDLQPLKALDIKQLLNIFKTS